MSATVSSAVAFIVGYIVASHTIKPTSQFFLLERNKSISMSNKIHVPEYEWRKEQRRKKFKKKKKKKNEYDRDRKIRRKNGTNVDDEPSIRDWYREWNR